jgi:hypothetical protein
MYFTNTLTSYVEELNQEVQVKVMVKVKVQFTLEQATKAQRGSRGVALFCL